MLLLCQSFKWHENGIEITNWNSDFPYLMSTGETMLRISCLYSLKSAMPIMVSISASGLLIE